MSSPAARCTREEIFCCEIIQEMKSDSAGKVEIEVEGIGWNAVEPQTHERPVPIHFVDGVRRVEARIILDDESGRIIRGLFGSAGRLYAACPHNRTGPKLVRLKLIWS